MIAIVALLLLLIVRVRQQYACTTHHQYYDVHSLRGSCGSIAKVVDLPIFAHIRIYPAYAYNPHTPIPRTESHFEYTGPPYLVTDICC